MMRRAFLLLRARAAALVVVLAAPAAAGGPSTAEGIDPAAVRLPGWSPERPTAFAPIRTTVPPPLLELALPAGGPDEPVGRDDRGGWSFRHETGFRKAGRDLAGAAAAAQLMDGRVALAASTLYGADLVDDWLVVTSRPLALGESWARDARIRVDLVRSDPVSLGINAGYARSRLPGAKGLGPLGVGEVERWREASLGGVGVDLGLWNDRLRYTTRFARASQRDLADRRGRTASRSGLAHSHRLDAMLWRSDGTELSAFGLHEAVDPGFRIHVPASAALTADLRRDSQVDRHRSARVAFGRHDRLVREAGIRLVAGRFDARLTTGSEGRPSRPGLREGIFGGQLEVGLEDRRKGGHGWRLVPGRVRLGAARRTIADDDLAGPDVAGELGLRLDWRWDHGSTIAELSHSRRDGRRPGAGRAGSEEWSAGLRQALDGPGWTLSLDLSASGRERLASGERDRELGHGAGLTYAREVEDRLALSLAGSLEHRRSERGQDARRSWRQRADLRASLDLSPWLRARGFEPDPHLTLNYRTRLEARGEKGTTSARLAHALTVSASLYF